MCETKTFEWGGWATGDQYMGETVKRSKAHLICDEDGTTACGRFLPEFREDMSEMDLREKRCKKCEAFAAKNPEAVYDRYAEGNWDSEW